MSQTPDINCRICGLGFEDYEISPVLKPVICSNCNAPAEIFNGVIIQDNGMDYFDVVGDINSRRGRMESMDAAIGGVSVINAHVPLSEMFGYVTTLRSLTQGRATPNVTPSHYEEVPTNIANEIMAKAQTGR